MAPRLPVGVIALVILFALGAFLLLWFDFLGLVP
jgi:hypothetical protein